MENCLFDFGKIVEGEYYPGTFLIGISKEFSDGIKYSDFTEEEMATFVHEYIHFLQDISTVAGAINYNHRAKLLQLHFYIFQKSPVVNLPLDLENCGVQKAYVQTELLSFYEGHSLEKKIHHINKVVCESEEIMTGILQEESEIPSEDDIEQINIYFDDSDEPTGFGSHYIMESMAYLIERNLFGAEERQNEFPYNACEMVCKYLYPVLLDTPEIIVALCELSLMHDHSGLKFFELVRHLADRQIHFKSLDEFYKYFTAISDAEFMRHETLFDEVTEAVNVMYPKAFSFVDVPNEYVRSYFEQGYDMRQYDPWFISRLFKENNPAEKVISWVNDFSVPLFLDDIKRELYGAMEYLSMMPVPLAILQFFQAPSNGCPLLEYCKYSHIAVTEDEICKNRPWEQCGREKLCPLSIYLTGFDIEKKEFIVNAKI